jgi:hypothetical protein
MISARQAWLCVRYGSLRSRAFSRRRVRFWDIRATGIFAVGTVTGNYVTDSGEGIGIGAGSTVIGNTARNSQVGFFVDCPSNVTDNTAAFNTTANLQLNGNGCNNTSNVAP